MGFWSALEELGDILAEGIAELADILEEPTKNAMNAAGSAIEKTANFGAKTVGMDHPTELTPIRYECIHCGSERYFSQDANYIIRLKTPDDPCFTEDDRHEFHRDD